MANTDNLELYLPSRYDRIPIDETLASNFQKIDDFAGESLRANGEFVIANRTHGIYGDGEYDDAIGIQNLLDRSLNNSNGITIVFPSGIYRLGKELIIRKNTQIIAHPKSVFLRDHPGNIARNYAKSDVFYGYNGNSNIIIDGGIWDANGANRSSLCNGFGFAHAENITFRNMTIKDVFEGHGIELSGIRKMLFDNCYFLGTLVDDPDHYYTEAIQLELANAAGYQGNADDYTHAQKITVQNCYFGNSGTPGAIPWHCGVGSHGAGYGIKYTEIKVVNNTFEGASYWAIRGFKWQNSIIANNNIIGGSGGIYVTVPPSGSASTKDVNGVERGAETIRNIVISNNVLNGLSGDAFFISGEPDAYLQHLSLTGNVARDIGGMGIRVDYTSYSIISDNLIFGAGNRGMSIDNVLRTNIRGNQLYNISHNGLFISNSKLVDIAHNYISDTDLYGINMAGSNSHIKVMGNHIGNVTQSSQGSYDGLIVSNGASYITITNNKFFTESGKKRPRYGLNIQVGTSYTNRFGNDIRANGTAGNVTDGASNKTNGPDDLV